MVTTWCSDNYWTTHLTTAKVIWQKETSLGS